MARLLVFREAFDGDHYLALFTFKLLTSRIADSHDLESAIAISIHQLMLSTIDRASSNRWPRVKCLAGNKIVRRQQVFVPYLEIEAIAAWLSVGV